MIGLAFLCLAGFSKALRLLEIVCVHVATCVRRRGKGKMRSMTDISQDTLWRWSGTLCLTLVIVLLVFRIFPGLDVATSALFHDAAAEHGAFPIAGSDWGRALRKVGLLLPRFLVIGLVLSLLWALVRPAKRMLIAPKVVLYLVSLMIVGPGIVTNLIFKNNWGRPRPHQVDLFGGDFSFVLPGSLSDACQSNCSFFSGEASAAFWLVAVALVVPIAWRHVWLGAMVPLAFVISLLRVMFGGHFLSDVTIAALATLLIALVWLWLFQGPWARVLDNRRMEHGLRRFGLFLHRGFATRIAVFSGRSFDRLVARLERVRRS